MDIYEETAVALEDAQSSRFKKFLQQHNGDPEELFWKSNKEAEIFESIKALRVKSKTYHKDTAR